MLPFSEVNLLACLGATVACMLLGMLWYGPLFGKQWMKLVGLKEEDCKEGMGKTMAMGLINTYLTTFALGLLLIMMVPTSLTEAITYALIPWFAFSAMGIISDSIWAKASWNLSFINVGYTFFMTLIMSSVLMAWPW